MLQNRTILDIDAKQWLELNAKLQQKKNKIRTELKEVGILKREGTNTFDKYKYFSEAQYKELFTRLFSENGLELKFTELEYRLFEGSDKQPNGRLPKIEFELIDIDTGFYEKTAITGEGVDKGDKAGYKAYTGALKYYLANTFMVATGDEAEKESPAFKTRGATQSKAIPSISTLRAKITTAKLTADEVEQTLKVFKVEKLEDLTDAQKIKLDTELTKKIKSVKENESGN